MLTCYDWTQEPSESWDQLVLERMLQIRDSYDYIRLMYSGGSDSHLIFKVCWDNDIFIDEIYHSLAASTNDPLYEDANLENRMCAIPYLRAYKTRYPNAKITLAEDNINFLYEKDADLFFKHNIARLNARHYMHYAMSEQHNDSNINWCWIVGDCDPCLAHKDGKFYSEVWETSNISVWNHIRNVEYFFTTPVFPKIHAKQCHILKNYIIKNNKYEILKDPFEAQTLKRELVRCMTPEYKSYHMLKDIITPLGMKNPKFYQSYRTFDERVRKRIRDLAYYKINSVPIDKVMVSIKCEMLPLEK